MIRDEDLRAYAVEVIEEMLQDWDLEDRLYRRLDPGAVADAMLAGADKHGPLPLSDWIDAREACRAAAAAVIATHYREERRR